MNQYIIDIEGPSGLNEQFEARWETTVTGSRWVIQGKLAEALTALASSENAALKDQISNALQAFSETHSDYEARCRAMAAHLHSEET